MIRLKGKQRHELRRKMRRLNEAGTVRFRLVAGEEEVSAFIEPFIDMFRRSRVDKQAFMTTPMAGFFRSLALAFVKHDIFKLGVLDFDAKPVAMVLCFDYRSTRYLYNSAYEPRYRKLNVGLMSKVLSIRDALEKGYACYDLLKGAEAYKRRLGAAPRAIYRIAIGMS
jgi:CelD/BcsL family acetyltransferase involved in cellulose biosynthesis